MKLITTISLLLFFHLTGWSSSEVKVVSVLEGDTIYLREDIEVIAFDETGYRLGSLISRNIEGRHGAIRLTGIRIEPYQEDLYPDDQVSSIGKKAFAYIRQRLADPSEKWFFIEDEEWNDDYGLPYGYLMNERGSILNVELVEKGYSCYYFKNGYSPKFHDMFWKAERTAFNDRIGIWDDSKENLERRSFYFWERRKWAYDNWKIAPPSLKIHGILIDNVGEKPKMKMIIIGAIVVLITLLFTGKRELQRIGRREGVSGLVFNMLLWKYNPMRFVLSKPVGILEEYALAKGVITQDDIEQRNKKKEKKKSKRNEELKEVIEMIFNKENEKRETDNVLVDINKVAEGNINQRKEDKAREKEKRNKQKQMGKREDVDFSKLQLNLEKTKSSNDE